MGQTSVFSHVSVLSLGDGWGTQEVGGETKKSRCSPLLFELCALCPFFPLTRLMPAYCFSFSTGQRVARGGLKQEEERKPVRERGRAAEHHPSLLSGHQGLSGQMYNLPGATLMMAPPFILATRSSLPLQPASSSRSKTLQPAESSLRVSTDCNSDNAI